VVLDDVQKGIAWCFRVPLLAHQLGVASAFSFVFVDACQLFFGWNSTNGVTFFCCTYSVFMEIIHKYLNTLLGSWSFRKREGTKQGPAWLVLQCSFTGDMHFPALAGLCFRWLPRRGSGLSFITGHALQGKWLV